MSPDEALELTATEQGERLAAGELSPVELTQAALARIAREDPRLHAFAQVLEDEARAEARRAEAALARGERRGPLHGVPLAVKDLVDLRGHPTHAGGRVLADGPAAEDACVAARLRAAGAVLLGKCVMTEGAFAAHHPEVAVPVNPWAPELWSGVSSSGSGVAVAARLCAGALGTDTGGSIRFPAAANGVTGMKPTYGRVPRHGVFPLAASLDHVGPLACSAADAAALLDAMAGFDARDPTSLRAPPPRASAALEAGVSGLRVGVDERFCAEGMDPEIVEAVLGAAETLRTLGVELRKVTVPPVDALLRAWPLVTGAEAAVAHEGRFPERAEGYGPALRGLLEQAPRWPAPDYARAHQERLAFTARLDGLFEKVDCLVTPSLGLRVPAERSEASAEAELGPDATALVMRFTAPFDFSGSPTLSLPCGRTRARMPVSLQLVGPRLEEARLLAAGHAYQRATGWHRERPPAAAPLP